MYNNQKYLTRLLDTVTKPLLLVILLFHAGCGQNDNKQAATAKMLTHEPPKREAIMTAYRIAMHKLGGCIG